MTATGDQDYAQTSLAATRKPPAARDLLNLRVSSAEGLADACANFHDYPFDLQDQHFDADSGTWTALFLRGASDPSRLTIRRWFWFFKMTEFPLIQVRVTIRNVAEAEIQDRAQIGYYTFRQLHRTPSGLRFEFHQDCDINVHLDGGVTADVCDVRERTDLRGRITSLGLVDFGIQVGPAREREFGDFI